MNKPFVAVIGRSGSGKSTLLKCVTGCKGHSVRDWVIDKATGRWIWVVASSPQEVDLSLAKLRSIIREAQKYPECIGIVMAIQPTQPRKRLSMEDIFLEVDASGAFQNYAYVITDAYNGLPQNPAATKARILVASPSTKVTDIDARRFGHLNAEIIKLSSGLPW